MLNRLHVITYLFFCLVFQAKSQDIHFSQFNGSLLNISPAFTGLFNGDYRVGAIYRSQWQTVPVKYSTFSMAGEARIKPRQLQKDMVGVGIMFNSDRAGDARYGSTQLYVKGSYIFLGNRDSTLIITVGANVGWCQVGFDYTKMTFDNQFDGLGYNQSFGSGESFSWTQYNFADINLGAAFQYIHKHKHRFTYGLGVHHISRPVIDYNGNDLSKLYVKTTNYFAYSTPIANKTDIITEALVSTQGKNLEFIPHASLKYYFNRDLAQAILGGLCFRTRDAVIFRMGYNYKTLQTGIAYDINISKFRAASNLRGGFEIFANYVMRNRNNYVAKKRVCPVFM